MADLVLSSFNVHAGVDGLGRPFDAVDACLALGADVLVLQETWTPDEGPSMVDELGRHGYQAHREQGMRACIYPPVDDPDTTWGPILRRRPGVGMRVPWPAPTVAAARARLGWVGLAVLSRVPVVEVGEIDLGQLPGDVPRSALFVDVRQAGATLRVVGVHMSHLRNGSPVQFRRLRRALGAPPATVVLGDMNLWGPPLGLLFPRWHRPVRGRTWPSWRPWFQIDHVLTSPDVSTLEATVVHGGGGSDHLPIRAVIQVPARRQRFTGRPPGRDKTGRERGGTQRKEVT